MLLRLLRPLNWACDGRSACLRSSYIVYESRGEVDIETIENMLGAVGFEGKGVYAAAPVVA